MKRTKKRQSADSEKKSAKCEDSREKNSSAVAFPENDSSSGQDLVEGTLPETGCDGSGDTNSSETLSLNLVLSLILNQKKKVWIVYCVAMLFMNP